MTDTARRAMLVVADHATDADDCRQLLAMLGLSAPQPKRKGRPPVDHGHGDHRTYGKGCRCNNCRDANRLYQAELRDRRKRNPSSADRAGHGKPSTYKNHGCRCAECTTANTEDVKAYKARRRQRELLAGAGGR